MAIISESKGFKLTEAERLELARLLIKAGYTVRIFRRTPPGAKTAEMVIDYSREGEKTNV